MIIVAADTHNVSLNDNFLFFPSRDIYTMYIYREVLFAKICERAFSRLPRRLIWLSNNRKIDRRPIVGPKVFFPPFILFGTHNTICLFVWFFFFFTYTTFFFLRFNPLVSLQSIYIYIYCIVRVRRPFFSGSSTYTDGIPKPCRRV